MEISKELAIDLLITAVEGGSNYWAEFKNYNPVEGSVTAIDWEEDPTTEYHITAEDLIKATQELLTSGEVAGWVLEGLPDDFDSITADCVLQKAIFGEVVYG